jgi:hypothetical protein
MPSKELAFQCPMSRPDPILSECPNVMDVPYFSPAFLGRNWVPYGHPYTFVRNLRNDFHDLGRCGVHDTQDI